MQLEVIYDLHLLWDASVLIKVSGDDGLDVHRLAHRRDLAQGRQGS